MGPKCWRALEKLAWIEDSEEMSPEMRWRFGLEGRVMGLRSWAVTLQPCSEGVG